MPEKPVTVARESSLAAPVKPQWHLGEARDLLSVAAAYVIAGKVGLRLAFINTSVTAVWPPTGIAIASLLVLGPRCWPAVFAGAFLVNLSTSGRVGTSIGIALGNTAEGLVGAYLVRRFAGGRNCFDRPRDVFRFAIVAGVLATAVAATVGVTTLSIAGLAGGARQSEIWLTWWLGDAGGALVVAPLLLLWSDEGALQTHRNGYAESLLLSLSVLLVGELVFQGWFITGFENQPIETLCLPVLVWVAIRYSPRVTALVVVALSVIAVWGTINGSGPFASSSPNRSLVLLALFMAVLSVTSLGISSIISLRRNAEDETRFQAFHDPLTGLPNRRLFRDRLDQALARARREGGLLVVAFLRPSTTSRS